MSEAVTKELPEGWQLCKLGDVMRLKNGYAFKSKDYSDSGVPLVRISDIKDGEVVIDKAVFIPDNLVIEDFLVEPGDLLIAMSGATTGKTGVYKGVKPVLQNQRVGNFKIIDETAVNKRYRDYYISSLRKDIEKAAYGGAQPNISSKGIEAFPFPVAPPEQQKRIVAKIEELFSHIDAGIEALKKAKQLLKQYRQSVLKAGVTGELTKEWRKANKDKLEPASQLLERILKERRQKWEEQQLEQLKAKGKMPKDDKWKKKYKEPKLPNAKNSEVIPDSWAYCGIEMLLPPDKAAMKTGPFGSLLKKHEHKTEGVPVLGIENIALMQFVPGSKIHITEKKAKELDGYKVVEGDVLISRSGTVGEVCVVPDMGEARISTNLMKLSLMKGGLNPVFFTYLFNGSPFVLGQVAELCKGSTRDFLNQDILKKLLIVLPSYQEQIEIINQVEEKFNRIERLDKEIDLQMLKAEKNKQSVLASGFSGRLGVEGVLQ